jgi:Family of unknown function (DUF6286)
MNDRNPNPSPDPHEEPPRSGPDDGQAAQTAPAEAPGPTGAHPQRKPAEERSRRPWGVRRVPAAVAAALILLAAGVLLFEAVWTRTGHSATAWWTRLTDEFATRPVNDVWILTGASVAAALGLWLLVLALTPGLHRRLPLRVDATGHGGTRAVLERKAAALLLRDAAMRVPGVSSVRVRVRRRHVTVRADVRFRDTATVKDELAETVRREEHDRLALARPVRPKVRVRRSPA